ncbi:MAG: hypothetical protein NXI30_28140 [bacterium]|nr:hypothetical protein [bacterium]
MIDSLFTLYCEDCEVAGRPSRLWVRAEIEVSTTRGPETQHYLECMNCGYRFKSCMEDHMEAVDDEEWNRFVIEPGSFQPGAPSPDRSRTTEGSR